MESNAELMVKILRQEKEIYDLEKENQSLKNNLKVTNGILKTIMGHYPVNVWTCKKRNTTSVQMRDGSVVIVRRRKGEKDDIYTAVAYAISKNLIGSKKFNELVKNATDHEPKKQ